MFRSFLLLLTLPWLPASAAVSAPLPQEPGPAGEEATPDFGGVWFSHFGYLDLVQTGKEVRGTYSCCHGEIEGKILGPMLEFFWKDPVYGEGWGHFYLQEEGRKIVGGWGNQDDMGVRGPWNAVRFDEPELSGQPAEFRVESTHPRYGELEATAQLVFSGDQVSGVLRGVYRMMVREQPLRQEVFYLLEGTSAANRVILHWRDPIDEETGEIPLLRQEDRLVGTWQAEDADTPESISFSPTDARLDEGGEMAPPSRETAATPLNAAEGLGGAQLTMPR